MSPLKLKLTYSVMFFSVKKKVDDIKMLAAAQQTGISISDLIEGSTITQL